MKKIKLTLFCCLMFVIASGVAQVQASGPLIQKNDLIYEGAFRVPKGKLGVTQYSRLARGGYAITYNPARNSLFIIGHPYGKMLTEISIPEIVNSSNIEELKTASILQPMVDITDGNWNNLTIDGSAINNGGRPGGFLVFGNKLIGSAYAYYDGGIKAALSHFTASPNWSETGTGFKGMYRVGENPINSANANGGFVGGYMTPVPSEWQEALGGPALTGMATIPIISRTSYGPCAWVFNPDDLGVKDPAPATMLVGYPKGHTTLGLYSTDEPNLYFNRATKVTGIVFPEGTSSVLFFGRHGLGITGEGDSCYGVGTADRELHGTPVPGTDGHVIYCYDPVNSNKGGHAYPYVYRIWAYDANDLAKVRKGEINSETGQPYQPWDIKPYAIWNLDFPFAIENAHILGAAYDPATQRIFISEYGGERSGYEPYPIIHVYKVNIPTGSGTVPPAPGPLRVKN